MIDYLILANDLFQHDPDNVEYNKYNPEHRKIHRFIRTLFNAAQLTAECPIITLVYLERLLKNAEDVIVRAGNRFDNDVAQF